MRIRSFGSAPIQGLLAAVYFVVAFQPAFAQEDSDPLSPAALKAGPDWTCSALTPKEKAFGWVPEEALADNPDLTSWKLRPSRSEVRGVVLMAHGIGLRPSHMTELAESYNQDGYDVLRLGLKGHTEGLEGLGKAQAGWWLREVFTGYCAASERARSQGVPLIFHGFSLGGLLGQTLINMKLPEPVIFDRTVLSAPAIALTKTASIALIGTRFFVFLGLGKVVIPGVDDDYSIEAGTSLRGFVALNDLRKILRTTGYLRSNSPTLVLIDPRDELVSFKGIQKIIRKNQLTNWSVKALQKTEDALTPYSQDRPRKHMIVDSTMLGSQAYKNMFQMIRKFLETAPVD